MKRGMQKAYKKGDRVLHEGKVYEAVQSYQGNGDQTGFMHYHYGKQCKLYLGMN